MTDLEEMGYRLLLGAHVDPRLLSRRRVEDARTAAQRHRELHEVDIRRMVAKMVAKRPF